MSLESVESPKRHILSRVRLMCAPKSFFVLPVRPEAERLYYGTTLHPACGDSFTGLWVIPPDRHRTRVAVEYLAAYRGDWTAPVGLRVVPSSIGACLSRQARRSL